MNQGIFGLSSQYAIMPKGLLGNPTPIPMPDQAWHPEAVDWRLRVIRNGGSVSDATTKAVSIFCTAIDGAAIRDKFYRLNLFCGIGLSSALVPLYRGPVAGGTALGNATDTNLNFVSADYNETGNACGLNGNGATKHLSTGLTASAFSSFKNLHMGVGLRKTSTSAASTMAAIGMIRPSQFRGWSIRVRRGDSDSVPNCAFGYYDTPSNCCGESVFTSALAIGNIVASWPTMARKGDAAGVAATAGDVSQTGAVPFTVFGDRNGDFSYVINYADIRLDWYSLGASLSASQVVSFNAALTAFQAALNRS